MSELNYLQFQEIDSSTDDISDKHLHEDEINLNEQIDEDSLESYWEQVVQDIHKDPDWFTFSDE